MVIFLLVVLLHTWNRKDYLLWFQESYDEGTRADLSSEDDFLYSRVSKFYDIPVFSYFCLSINEIFVVN